MKKIIAAFVSVSYFCFPHVVSAHEAYVLTRKEFLSGLQENTANPLAPLLDTSHIQITLIITLCIMLSYFLVILWSTTKFAAYLDTLVKKAAGIGPLIIRLAISSSFFYAALSNSVFGPELSLIGIPGGSIIRFLLFVVALTIFFGIFTEVSSLVGLAIFAYITKFFGAYMVTYVNYLGELLVLFLFGSRLLSFDQLFFGKQTWLKNLDKWKKYEIPIVRVLYGIALIYAGITIKFQHQQISVWVYNQYHLKDFFHASAAFIAAGAGLSEILIGLFILVGFAMRFTIIISLFFITISLLYFHELIWPHLMLYGISFSLLINSADLLTVDRYMIPRIRLIIQKICKIIGK